MSKKLLVPANLPGVQIPEGYMLVQHVNPTPNAASNSKPQPGYGKNWNRNQRKRERAAAQLTADGIKEPVRNPGAIPPPASAETGITPVAIHPMSPAVVETGPSSYPCPEPEKGDVIVESQYNRPGYNTVSYAQHKADKLAVMNKHGLSAEAMLNHVQRLLKYLYSLTRILACPDPGSESEVVRTWRYSNNGSIVITGGNIISVTCEILFYFKLYGNPVEGDKFLSPALDCVSIHAGMKKGEFLKQWNEEEILQMHPDQILAKLDSVTKSETSAILKKFLNVLDNCGQLVARLPQSIYQPCLKFVGRTDEPRWINDAYVMGSSTRYNQALNVLVKHVQNPHVPLLGVNQINLLLRGTGISLNRFTGFAQAEGRVVDRKNKDNTYPSSMDLLNLCGLPLPAQYQTEEIQKLKQQLNSQTEENQKLREKLDHLIVVQVQTSNQLCELKDIILQASGVSQTGTVARSEPSIDDKLSIDSLLADEDNQDMEQEGTIVQHTKQSVAQEPEVDVVPQPLARDELLAAVDNIMVDLQNQN